MLIFNTVNQRERKTERKNERENMSTCLTEKNLREKENKI